MPSSITPLLDKLQWYRLKAEFKNRRLIPSARAHPVVIIESIIKQVSELGGGEFFRPLVFHVRGKGLELRLKIGLVLPVEFFFFGCDIDDVESWKRSLEDCFSDKRSSRNFELEKVGPVEARNYGKLIGELPEFPDEGEICLEFLTPMPFKPQAPKRRTAMDERELVESFKSRYRRIFGVKLEYRGNYDEFKVLPCFWRYTEMSHMSGSSPRKKHIIKGCIGNLYIKGSLRNIMPFIVLGTELHAGRTLSFSLGYYRLHPRSLPYFDERFPNRGRITSAMRDVQERYDHVCESLPMDGDHSSSEERFIDRLMQKLRSGSYVPEPNRAFLIKKASGAHRLVERPSAEDMIVQYALYKTLEPVIDKLLEPESIGFRRGVSRMKAAELVRRAAKDGYKFVIESDIEDFFSSVNIERLMAIIDLYLPERDTNARILIERILRTDYNLNGKNVQRSSGLAQGSPLSPILANLYLDDFDEHVKALGVRIIRYADDFIILTKTREEAEKVLANTEVFLSEMGLGINRKKTSIKSLQESFSFLGITFTDGLGEIETDEAVRRLKKPLYVTEPHLFAALSGDAVEIRRRKKLIDTIPIRRINEIVIMGSSIISTALIRRCTESGIPITITTGTGYFVTTVKPDSKRYLAVSHAHSAKYHGLSTTEILCFAKDIASAKLQNYASLFKKRYKKGACRLIIELEETIGKIQSAIDVDQVRGFEGWAARRIYAGLNDLIMKPGFHLQRRRRSRPDPINSLLNFGYYLLFTRMNATVRTVGLDPYLGFLHSPADNYESLVCDVEELFRARIDRFIIRLINLKIISVDDFKKTERGHYLKHEALKRFISHFERELVKKASPRTPSLLDYICAQIMVIKKWVMEDQTLSFYRWS